MSKQLNELVIAIDGHSSGGKSTFAKAIAKRLGLTYVDSGAMYRAVALYALEQDLVEDGRFLTAQLIEALRDIHISFRNNEDSGLAETWLNGKNVEQEIRSVEVSHYASSVSTIPEVRAALVARQREMSHNEGVVMDGRDIGTVVFPDADIKIYLTAKPEIRARRRFEELKEKGKPEDYEEVLRNIVERDERDSTRVASPLKKADDAIELDNSGMSVEEQMDWFMNLLALKFTDHEQDPD